MTQADTQGSPKMDDTCPQCEATVDRRTFVVGTLASVSVGATALFSATMIGRAVMPPSRSIEGKTKPGPLAVGRAEDLQPEKPVLAEYGDDVVYMVKLADERLLVLNAACPHVACKLAFNEATKEFDCPCHASSFSIEGTLLGGPAPRDMIAAKFEVVEGEVVVSGFEV
jgi:Rieske Fe-S protein